MANTKVTSRVLANDAVMTANIADDQVTTAKIADDVALGGNPTTTTQSAGNNTTRIATTAFVTTAVANLADSAPAALDTLNELAAALGDDANFSTTVTNSIATKLPLAGGTLTGGLTGTSATFTDDVAINNSSPELYFGTTGNHYNWRIAAQENVDAALTIDVGSQDTAYGDDTYSSVFTLKNTGTATFNNYVIAGATNDARVYFNASSGYSPRLQSSTNDLSIYTNNEARVTILNDGKVGIGESPTRTFTVKSAAANSTQIALIDNDSTNEVISIGQQSDGDGFLQIKLDDGTGKVLFDASGTSYINGGNVGIGTTSPSSYLATKLVLGCGDEDGMTLAATSSSTKQNIYFADGTSGSARNRGNLSYDHNLDQLSMGTASGSQRFVMDSSGNVGIGDNDPDYLLDMQGTIGDQAPLQRWTVTGTPSDSFNWVTEAMSANLGQDKRIVHAFGKARSNGNSGTMSYVPRADSGNNAITFGLFGKNDILNITYNGYVGIGTISPDSLLNVEGIHSQLRLTDSDDSKFVLYSYSGGKLIVRNNSADTTTNQFTLLEDGKFGLGTISPSAKLHVNQTTVNEETVFLYNNTATNAACLRVLQDSAGSSGVALWIRQDGSGNAITVDDGSDGNTVFSVSQNGALSKASGSFKIDHPLPAKKDTHHLVHSFVEAPQADNIYRGTATLSGGTATINLDTVSGMTEGTYVLLNTNTSCFTSNETDWDAVKGSVSGNILTINCQNSSSTATVSWLVIGERHDKHMKDTDWTDDNGKVIVEPLKEE